MTRGDDIHNEKSFDRDDEGEELGGFTGGIPYDEDEDEDGGWAINKDQSDSLWDSAEESDDEDEETTELVDAAEGSEEEETDLFGGSLTAPKRRGRRPAEKPVITEVAVTVAAAALGAESGEAAVAKAPGARGAASKAVAKTAAKPAKPAKAKAAPKPAKTAASKKKPAKAAKKAPKAKAGKVATARKGKQPRTLAKAGKAASARRPALKVRKAAKKVVKKARPKK